MTKTIQQIVLLLIFLIVVSVVAIGAAIAQDSNHIASSTATAQMANQFQQQQVIGAENANAIAAQTPPQSPSKININPETGVPKGAILLTVFLKHDQSKTLEKILNELKQSGYWKAFPPEGVDVVSWYVMMGIGQVVTLAVPPERLRAVNTALERTAWSAYRTEFYATYDFAPIAKKSREQALKGS
ncbi:MAG: hypothetical protein KME42_11845 [Tildeniella nuda ZEHNDER 1965/U140]|nr:hypothetical protein [Tildeniella nuda ZEHNDER 1965/U140]